MENNDMQEHSEIVTLIDDSGREVCFEHILTFPYESEKYAALVPQEQIDSDEAEVVFVKITKTDDGDVYVPVDNEILLDELFEEFNILLDELYLESEDD